MLLNGADLDNFVIESTKDIEKFNKFSKKKILTNHIDCKWLIPDTYKYLDLEVFFNKFNLNLEQKDRVTKELNIYAKNNLFDVLRLMIFLVDEMKKGNVVWGVGRGSSVSSYLLYLIGVHKVDSFKYNLDIKEFIK
jgi:DNA polymerase III alpha subunit